MISVEEICDRYESGYGHGLNGDGLDSSKTPHNSPELAEAYQYGYEQGAAKRAVTLMPMYQHKRKEQLAYFYHIPVTCLDLPAEVWAYIRDGHDAKYPERLI